MAQRRAVVGACGPPLSVVKGKFRLSGGRGTRAPVSVASRECQAGWARALDLALDRESSSDPEDDKRHSGGRLQIAVLESLWFVPALSRRSGEVVAHREVLSGPPAPKDAPQRNAAHRRVGRAPGRYAPERGTTHAVRIRLFSAVRDDSQGFAVDQLDPPEIARAACSGRRTTTRSPGPPSIRIFASRSVRSHTSAMIGLRSIARAGSFV